MLRLTSCAAVAAAVASVGSTAQAAAPVTAPNFNPAVSLILNGTFANFSRTSSTYALPGFALGGETGPGDEGFRLGESELALSANVDDKFYAAAHVSLTPENEAVVEEAFFET